MILIMPEITPLCDIELSNPNHRGAAQNLRPLGHALKEIVNTRHVADTLSSVNQFLGPASNDLSPQEVATMAQPVVEHIAASTPDVVIGCDRGARLYSLAVYRLWSELNPKKRFPTADGKLHFARLSKTLSPEEMDQALFATMDRSGAIKKERPDDREVRITVIDDWVNSGQTRQQIEESLDRLGINYDLTFAVMCGKRADITGTARHESVSWLDDPSVTGVDYGHRNCPEVSIRDKGRSWRKRMYQAAKSHAAELVAAKKRRVTQTAGKLATSRAN